MTLYEKLMNLDRRWIYLAVGIAVLVPFFIPFDVPVYTTPEVKAVYDFVESLKGGDLLFLAIDYDPNAMAELQPTARVILRQAFTKNVKLVISALSQNGPGMAEQLISEISRQYNKKSGVDFVYLGYKPYPGITILAMGQNFRIPFPTDYYGVPLDSLPMMTGIKNYDDVKAVLDVTGTNAIDYWLVNANARYKVKMAAAVTGVMAADYYPYLQSGQLFGLIPGLKGASEYEVLANQKGFAFSGMRIQTVAHIMVILLIVVGNIGFFMARAKKKG